MAACTLYASAPPRSSGPRCATSCIIAANDRLTHAAARQWFVDAINAIPEGDPNAWDIDGMLGWLTRNGSVTLDPDGHYRLALIGYKVLGALTLPDLYVAPKLV